MLKLSPNTVIFWDSLGHSTWYQTVKFSGVYNNTRFEKQCFYSRIHTLEYRLCKINLAWASTNQQVNTAHHTSSNSKFILNIKSAEFLLSYKLSMKIKIIVKTGAKKKSIRYQLTKCKTPTSNLTKINVIIFSTKSPKVSLPRIMIQ